MNIISHKDRSSEQMSRKLKISSGRYVFGSEIGGERIKIHSGFVTNGGVRGQDIL